MRVVTITHGDDVDGLTCGAFLKRLVGGETVFANYDNLEEALQGVEPPVDRVYICDLNLRDQLEPLLARITGFSQLHIYDHHQMSPRLMEALRARGASVRLETGDCAAMLVWDSHREELGWEARRMAGYAAISDMFEEGPIAQGVLARLDRKFTQHEAQLLTHALWEDPSKEFKYTVMEHLSRFEYPHRIPGLVEKAVDFLEEMARLKELIAGNARVEGRVGFMEVEGHSTGVVANLIIEALGVDVAVGYKLDDSHASLSLRGWKGLQEHLGELCMELGSRFHGFGGGHSRASGIKVPRENLEPLLSELKKRLNP